MVEVFKTNVCDRNDALSLIEKMKERTPVYKVNFDLLDKDKILRIESHSEVINPSQIIELLRALGFEAEILPD